MTTAGKHLGGVRTIDDIHARCEEVGECWEWQRGYQNHGRTPCAVHGKLRLPARRLAWMLANGKKVPTGHVIVSTCGNTRCVNPSHTRAMKKTDCLVLIAAKPISASRREKIIATKRAQSRVTQAMRQAALTIEGPAHVAAAALGIAVSTVSKIRRSAPAAGNPFAGLIRGAA